MRPKASPAVNSARILLFIRSLNVGGAQRQLVLLASRLYRMGLDVVVLTFYPGGALAEDLKAEGVPTFDLEKTGRWEIFRFYLRFIQFVWRVRPAVVYSFLPTANILTSSLKLFRRSPRVVWGIRASYLDLRMYGWPARAEQRLAICASRLADAIICNSEAGITYHRRIGFPGRKMRVIANGIDTTRFVFDSAGRERLRAEWSLPEDTFLIGAIGRIDPMKDYETFLEMASLMLPQCPRVAFVCVGNGRTEYKTRLKQRAEELDLASRLRWVDDDRDAVSVYSALDLFCSSSSGGEGFSNVIAEAMACERPCVVTDVGDSRRLVADIGVVVPPGDRQAMATACLQLFKLPSELRTLMGSRARQHVESHFGIQRLISETCDALGVPLR
jgi:glycosyltransferase involved in cell wall biosynthesis